MNIISLYGNTIEQVRSRQRRNGFLLRTGRVLLELLVLLVGMVGIGATYQTIATAVDQRTYPPPGQLVDVGGYRLHIHCIGQGSPTVILESGNGQTSVDWYAVQPAIATTTRVCVYDRAGLGWSEAGPAPRDAQQITHELHTLLGKANITSPYVLVGHSYGGLYTRMYADQYPDEVAGMVLLDASHPDQWRRTPDGQTMYSSFARQVRLAALVASIGIVRLQNNLQQLPPTYVMPADRFAQYRALMSSTHHVDAGLAEFLASTATMDQVRATRSLGRLPLAVVTAGGDHTHGIAQLSALEQMHMSMQRELAELSANSIHVIVEGSDHTSLLFNPEHVRVTIAAIQQIVDSVRTGQPLHQ